ncbi:MAG: FAD/NAD(P)-binding protein [Acidobacteriota bacterium]|nr:FAD/NAD(P)-binding protein [Acidobacteriota bacterium]
MNTARSGFSTEKTIAIIGGGVSGALTAYHLVAEGVQARVVVIDPGAELGLGLAYSTASLRHLLNVPAGKISALPQEPGHFFEWLRANYDAEATEAMFAPRAVFGRYVQGLVSDVRGLEQIRKTVINYTPSGAGAALTLNDGSELLADLIVLATGNFDPADLPGISKQAKATGAYCHNAWLPSTYEGLAPDASVTLIGTGLTGVDVLLRLRELGHRGVVTAVSRHGVFPNRHADYTPLLRTAIPAGTTATCLAYLRAVRSAIAYGAEWRAAIDSLRASTNDLWLALPLAEQKRFRRHLQRRWEVVRHRMAPPIADAVQAELKGGTLVLREGHLAEVKATSCGAQVMLRTSRGCEELLSNRVINCTGPSMDYRRVRSPLLQSLFAQGVATTGPLGSGFNCSRSGAMIGADGRASRVLFNLGPGRLGTLLESIAIPEIREQAAEIAAMLVRHVEASSESTTGTAAAPTLARLTSAMERPTA